MKKTSKLLAILLAVVMVLSAFPFSAFALDEEMENAQVISLNETVEVPNYTYGGYKWFKFTAEEDGTYAFYSFNNEFDTRCFVYDALGELILEDDDGGKDNNFKAVFKMEAGDTFYLKSMPYSEESFGKYSVSINKLEKAEGFSLHTTEEIVLYEGSIFYVFPYFSPDGSAEEQIVSAESDDQTVLLATAQGDSVSIYADSEGEATVTATTENGLVDTLKVTVLPRETISAGEKSDFYVDEGYLNKGFVFKPEKSATYIISIEGDDEFYSFTDVYDEFGSQINCQSGYSYSFSVELQEGVNYYIYCKKNETVDLRYEELSISIEEAIMPTAITLIAPSEKIYNRQEFKIEYTLEPANANALSLYWEIGNPEILQSFGDGVFYSNNEGTTTITVTAGNGVTDSIEIVVNPYEAISLDESVKVSLGNGNYKKYCSFTPTQSGEYTFDFSVDEYFSTYYSILDSEFNELAYTWNCYERLTVTLQAGQTYVASIMSYEEEGNVNLTVRKAIPPETFDIITYNRGKYYVDDSFSLETLLTPNGCSDKVEWESSDESVAFCSENGWVYVVGTGNVTITGTTSNGLTDTFTFVAVEIPQIKINQKYNITLENQTQDKEEKFVFIPEETGYYEFFFESNSSFGAAFGIDGEGQIGHFNESFNAYVEKGTEYYLNVYTYGDCSFTVRKANGIKSVEILTLPKQMEYIKGFENFEYYGLTAKVTLEDGTSVIYDYNNDDTAAGYAVLFEDIYNDNEEYVETLIKVGSASDSIKFILKENTVESIEYVGGTLELIENGEGFFDKDYKGEEFFYYDYESLIEDIRIKINFTDRESVIVDSDDCIDGCYLSFGGDQYDKHWTLGNDNYITVTYLDKTVEVPVSIVSTPVRKIVVNKAPSKIYYEHDYYSGSYAIMFYPILSDLTDLSFTVYFKDGTSKTYTDKDIDDYGKIDGYYFEIDYPYEPDFGNVEIVAKYMGVEFSYNVVYKEFPYKVKNVKVVKLPANTEYIDGYFPDFTGMVVEITYEDGTTKSVELTKDNMKYKESEFAQGLVVLLVDVDGLALMVDPDLFSDNWEEGFYRVTYGGVSAYIEDMEAVSPKKVESIDVSGVNDIVITVNYADSTKETYRLNDALDLGSTKLFKTQNGFLTAFVWDWEEDGTIVYEIYICDQSITYEVSELIGDVNGDENVDAADLALLKKVIAKLVPINDTSIVNPNVDGEGSEPDAADLAMLKKIIAKLI